MNIYNLKKEDLKKLDKEFSKTIYGKYITLGVTFSFIIFGIALILSVFITAKSFSSMEKELLNIGMIFLVGALITYSFSIICYILRLKEL